MGRHWAGDEDSQGQQYCSECGQPIPPAAGDETHAQPSQDDSTEPREAARGSTPRPRSGRRPVVRASERSRPSDEPPTKPWYRKPLLVVPLGVLAIVIAAAAVGLGALLGGKSETGATTQSPKSTPGSESNKKQSSVAKWTTANQSKSESLSKAIQVVAAADVAGPYTAALRSGCQELKDASGAFAGALPAPNTSLNKAVREATDAFDRAAKECITGVDARDSAAIDRFRSDLGDGQKQIGVASYIISRFNQPR